jgi:hypothetical protein
MKLDEQRRDWIVCPGCGGRNEPGARECDWCGRLFVPEHRSLNARWLAPAAIGGVVVLMMSIATFVLVGSRSASRTVASMPTPAVAADTHEEEEPEGTVVVTLPTLAPLTFTPPSTATETEVRAEDVRIVNTGGTGAFYRREARAAAPGIVAYRDGTVLRIVGPDVTAEGRVWRNVEDRQGTRGWTPREYLEPSPTGF